RTAAMTAGFGFTVTDGGAEKILFQTAAFPRFGLCHHPKPTRLRPPMYYWKDWNFVAGQSRSKATARQGERCWRRLDLCPIAAAKAVQERELSSRRQSFPQ